MLEESPLSRGEIADHFVMLLVGDREHRKSFGFGECQQFRHGLFTWPTPRRPEETTLLSLRKKWVTPR